MRVYPMATLTLMLLTVSTLIADPSIPNFEMYRLHLEFKNSPIVVRHSTVISDFGNGTIDSLISNQLIDSLVPVFIEPPSIEERELYYNLGMDKFWEVHFHDTLEMAGIYSALQNDAGIELVDTIFFGNPNLEPLDLGYPEQWYHSQANDIDIDAPEGWDFDTTAGDALLAILD